MWKGEAMMKCRTQWGCEYSRAVVLPEVVLWCVRRRLEGVLNRLEGWKLECLLCGNPITLEELAWGCDQSKDNRYLPREPGGWPAPAPPPASGRPDAQINFDVTLRGWG